MMRKPKPNDGLLDFSGPFTIIALILFALLIAACLFFFPKLNTGPDYAAPPKEPDAIEIPDDQFTGQTGTAGPETEGTNAAAVFSPDMTLNADTGVLNLVFQNPSVSQQNMTLEIYVNDVQVKTTGLIEPGTGVIKLQGLNISNLNIDLSKLPTNVPGRMVAHHYDMATNEKSIVDLDMPVTVTVTGTPVR